MANAFKIKKNITTKRINKLQVIDFNNSSNIQDEIFEIILDNFYHRLKFVNIPTKTNKLSNLPFLDGLKIEITSSTIDNFEIFYRECVLVGIIPFEGKLYYSAIFDDVDGILQLFFLFDHDGTNFPKDTIVIYAFDKVEHRFNGCTTNIPNTKNDYIITSNDDASKTISFTL